MISVIVPVYNVELYLRKCLDSILAQTYQDLEILIIDDGSIDGSGAICNEYAEKDERIRVFHTENRGLSCARNLGLDKAQGEWIGFVDSDDWVEPDMYEVLLLRAEETGADVVESGLFLDYANKSVIRERQSLVLTGKDAIKRVVRGEFSNAVWNKIWKHRCFNRIRFPEGRVFEEYATTYRVYDTVDIVSTVKTPKYHYLQRKDSLSNVKNIKNLTGFWLSHRERYEYLKDKMDEETNSLLLKACASSAARTWAYYCDCSKEDRKNYFNYIIEMKAFTKEMFPLFGDSSWELSLRVGIAFPHCINAVSFRLAWFINRINMKKVASQKSLKGI